MLFPSQVTISGLQRVLQNLLAERISIRDLPTILEGISEATAVTRNLTAISEHVRTRLSRQISDANTNDMGYIPMVTLSPEWEQAFAEAVIGEGDARQLAMPPSKLQQFITAVRQSYDRLAAMGRVSGSFDQPGYSRLCAVGGRAVPSRDDGFVAKRNSSRRRKSKPWGRYK